MFHSIESSARAREYFFPFELAVDLKPVQTSPSCSGSMPWHTSHPCGNPPAPLLPPLQCQHPPQAKCLHDLFFPDLQLWVSSRKS